MLVACGDGESSLKECVSAVPRHARDETERSRDGGGERKGASSASSLPLSLPLSISLSLAKQSSLRRGVGRKLPKEKVLCLWCRAHLVGERVSDGREARRLLLEALGHLAQVAQPPRHDGEGGVCVRQVIPAVAGRVAARRTMAWRDLNSILGFVRRCETRGLAKLLSTATRTLHSLHSLHSSPQPAAARCGTPSHNPHITTTRARHPTCPSRAPLQPPSPARRLPRLPRRRGGTSEEALQVATVWPRVAGAAAPSRATPRGSAAPTGTRAAAARSLPMSSPRRVAPPPSRS
jgi:hypothetical protein